MWCWTEAPLPGARDHGSQQCPSLAVVPMQASDAPPGGRAHASAGMGTAMAPVSSSCALEVEYKYTGKFPGSHGLEKQKQKKPRKTPSAYHTKVLQMNLLVMSTCLDVKSPMNLLEGYDHQVYY
jgi:hypothetical protein